MLYLLRTIIKIYLDPLPSVYTLFLVRPYPTRVARLCSCQTTARRVWPGAKTSSLAASGLFSVERWPLAFRTNKKLTLSSYLRVAKRFESLHGVTEVVLRTKSYVHEIPHTIICPQLLSAVIAKP